MCLPQLYLGECLVGFLTKCGTTEVLLDLKQSPELSSLIKLKVDHLGARRAMMPTHSNKDCARPALRHRCHVLTTYGAAGGRPQMCQAGYKLGSRELLDAVDGPCQQQGIRCTDVTGTGQHFLFEPA